MRLKTYGHGEHGIGGLEAVGAFLPEIAVPLHGGYIASNAISRLCHNHIAAHIAVLGGESLSDAEAADSRPDDDAVHRRVIISVADLGGRNCRLPGDGTSDSPWTSAIVPRRSTEKWRADGGGAAEIYGRKKAKSGRVSEGEGGHGGGERWCDKQAREALVIF